MKVNTDLAQKSMLTWQTGMLTWHVGRFLDADVPEGGSEEGQPLEVDVGILLLAVSESR